jgi:hypothetical protein
MNSESGEVVGIIYAAGDANNMFGNVTKSVGIRTSELSSLAEESGSYIMFLIKDDKILILDEHRNLLYPQGEEFSSDTVFNYFSKAKLLELLNIGDSSETFVENRQEVLSITNGNFTLENSRPCPPYCPDFEI